MLLAQNQYGYRTNLPATDAIAKIEAYLEQSTPETQLLLMDRTKASGKVNRAIPWITPYKKGITIQTISHIRRGRRNATLHSKRNGTY